MKIRSSAFEHEQSIPSKYTCDGAGINPQLTISDVPEAAKSLALIMDDPDVPTSIRQDGLWNHWIVYDMPPRSAEIPEGQRPEGTEGTGTSGDVGYFGPCPPDGEHRYFFRLYALDQRLGLSAGVSREELEAAMDGHVIEQAELMGRYDRRG